MIKRLLVLMMVLALPLALGLLFTYEVIKVDWVSFMEIQPSFRPQEDPLPLPAGSVPVQGAAYIPGAGAPVNPVEADELSLARGKQLYDINCALCHGPAGQGNGPFAAFLRPRTPANLTEGNALSGSDGAMFMVITNGVPGAMPALKENLDVRSRWDVVNYVRQLQQNP
jgi:mono/diheme cytochrome c family protein